MKRIIALLAAAAAIISCAQPDEQSINVIPYPNEVNLKCGSFVLEKNENFFYSGELDQASQNAIRSFAEQLSGNTEGSSNEPSKFGTKSTVSQSISANIEVVILCIRASV